MGTLTLTEEGLRLITLFEKVTGVPARDVVAGEEIVLFLVSAGSAGLAVGPGGGNAGEMARRIRMRVEVVEDAPEPEKFVRNLFHRFGVRDVRIEDKRGKKHAVVAVDPAQKGRAIGKGGAHLRLARELLSRHHSIESMVVE